MGFGEGVGPSIRSHNGARDIHAHSGVVVVPLRV